MQFVLYFALAVCVAPLVFSYENIEEVETLVRQLQNDPVMQLQLQQHEQKWQEAKAKDNYKPGQANYSCPGIEPVSPQIPTSVHALRPGDIKIVGAMGDSLTAANGAGANNVLGVLEEFRGVAFAMGGDGTLEATVSIPNVVRKFNPHLFGQSKGIGGINNTAVSQLNCAIPGNTAVGIPAQAVELVKRLKTWPEVDLERDWKLITIFYGGNDVCAYCKNPDKFSAAAMKTNIRTALKTIYDNIPRVIVQILGMFHLEMLRKVGTDHLICNTMHSVECPCSVNKTFTDANFSAIVAQYQQAQNEIMTSGEFERDDFTLVIQPMIRDTLLAPHDNTGKVDLTFFAPDCFHFSVKGHNTAARGLWNNMMEPIGAKETNANFSNYYLPMKCPDPKCPFIRTTKNSVNCSDFYTPPTDSAFAPRQQSNVVNSNSEQNSQSPIPVGYTIVGIALGVVFAAVVVIGSLMYHRRRKTALNSLSMTSLTSTTTV